MKSVSVSLLKNGPFVVRDSLEIIRSPLRSNQESKTHVSENRPMIQEGVA
jgi:hypothetical protein